MKRKTVISLTVSAQNQSIRTKIERSQEDSLCRLFRKAVENIYHIVSGYCMPV